MQVDYEHGKHRAPVETAQLHSEELSDKASIPSHKHSVAKPAAAGRTIASGMVRAHAATVQGSKVQHTHTATVYSASTAHRSEQTHSRNTSGPRDATTVNPSNRRQTRGPDGSGASKRGKHAMDIPAGSAEHRYKAGSGSRTRRGSSQYRGKRKYKHSFLILTAAIAGATLVLLICIVLNVQQHDSVQHSKGIQLPTVTAVPTLQPTPTPTPLPTPTPTPTPVPTPTPPTTLSPDKAWPVDMHSVSGSYQTDKTLGLPESAPVDDSFFDDAVFVGDSITLALRNYVTQQRKGEYPDMLGKAKFLTTGSFGIHNAIAPVTKSSIHPVIGGVKMTLEDALAKMNARKVYLMLGMNDIAFTGIDISISNMGSLLKRIREKLPEALIFVQSVTPRLRNTREPTTLSIFSYNKQLYQRLAPLQPEGIYFVDVAFVMRDSVGYLKEAYCSDPDGMAMHFTFDGCLEWVKFLYTHTPYAEADNYGTDDTILPAPEDLLDETPLTKVAND